MGYDKIVKGATKLKMAAPKAKYIEPILQGTGNPIDLEDIMRSLSPRLRDSAWTIVFKGLIVIHIMIREGKKDVTLEYLSHHARILDCSQMTAGAAGRYGDMITRYSKYLQDRVRQFASLKIDFVRHKKDNPTQGRLRNLSIDKGLLREVESLQSQIKYLLRCRFSPSDVNDDITLTAFRLLVHDLLALHQAVNEGMINVLEHYFEMSKYDAERALAIYKTFVDEMEGIVEYLQVARKLESATRLSVPNIMHAPTSLTQALEEYLNDPDFDVNRRQFLAEKEAKLASHRKDVVLPNPLTVEKASTSNANTANTASIVQKKSPEQSLVDFFASIEQQESMFPDQSPAFNGQQTAFQTGQAGSQIEPASTYGQPPAHLSQDFTGAGFGGYSAQAQAVPYAPQYPQFSQQFSPQWQQPSVFDQTLQSPTLSSPAPITAQPTGSTNPFRQSTMFTGIQPQFSGVNTASSNPFTKSTLTSVPEVPTSPRSTNPFAKRASMSPVKSPAVPAAVTTPLVAQATGTNPFRRF